MSKAEFWFVVAAWYVLLAAMVAAGITRFGGDYMIRWFADPSLKTALLLAFALVPVPFVVRRVTRS